MPAVTTITQLPAINVAQLTNSALIAVDDALGQTRKVTLAQLRGASSIFNVTAYGAKGDGVTDDTLAIQAAVDAAFAAGGGLVTFPAGFFPVSRQGVSPSAAGGYAVRMKSGVSIRGEGRSSVILNGGQNPNTASDDGTWYSAFECVDGTHDLTIEGVRWLGTNSAPFVNALTYWQRQMDCIGFRGTTCRDITVVNCHFESQIGFTCHLEGFGQRVHVIDCFMKECANGLNVNSDYSVQSRNILIDTESIECSGAYTVIAQNIIVRPVSSGIGVGGYTSPGRIPGVVVTNNVITDGLDVGISVADAIDGAVVTDNTVLRTVRSGIQLAASSGVNTVQRVRVSGNTLIDCGKPPQVFGDRCGIYCPTNSQGVIENNTIEYGITAGYDSAYGINVGTGAPGLVIRGNRVRGSFKAISIQSAGVLVSDDNLLDWNLVEINGAGSYMSLPNREGVVLQPFPGTGGAVVLDPRAGTFFRLNVTDTTAFAVQTNAAPGGMSPTATQRLTLIVFNSAGAGMGALTFSAAGGSGFRTAGAFTTPANGKMRSISFYWDQLATLWVEYQRAAADI